jgi:hypothetical protein
MSDEFLYTLVAVGGPGCGKSCIVHRLVDDYHQLARECVTLPKDMRHWHDLSSSRSSDSVSIDSEDLGCDYDPTHELRFTAPPVVQRHLRRQVDVPGAFVLFFFLFDSINADRCHKAEGKRKENKKRSGAVEEASLREG